jgi:hypothetical protein
MSKASTRAALGRERIEELMEAASDAGAAGAEGVGEREASGAVIP